jgi:hypothetical protein
MSRNIRFQFLIILSFLFSGLVSTAEAYRSVSRTTVHTNRRVHHNANRHVHVDRNVHVDVHGHHQGCCFNPVATAAAVTAATIATAAVVGSIVNTLPPSCSTMVINGIAYQQCDNTWYQPQYAGTAVQYVVINPPR